MTRKSEETSRRCIVTLGYRLKVTSDGTLTLLSEESLRTVYPRDLNVVWNSTIDRLHLDIKRKNFPKVSLIVFGLLRPKTTPGLHEGEGRFRGEEV